MRQCGDAWLQRAVTTVKEEKGEDSFGHLFKGMTMTESGAADSSWRGEYYYLQYCWAVPIQVQFGAGQEYEGGKECLIAHSDLRSLQQVGKSSTRTELIFLCRRGNATILFETCFSL